MKGVGIELGQFYIYMHCQPDILKCLRITVAQVQSKSDHINLIKKNNQVSRQGRLVTDKLLVYELFRELKIIIFGELNYCVMEAQRHSFASFIHSPGNFENCVYGQRIVFRACFYFIFKDLDTQLTPVPDENDVAE